MQLTDLKTPRLMLEPLEVRHAREMFDGLQARAAYDHISGDHPPLSVEELASRYADLEQRVRMGGTRHWLNWAVRRRADSICLGYVQATAFLEDGLIFIAAHLFPAHWRQGIGKEAVGSMLDWLGETYPGSVFEASIASGNTASLALAESLGFHRVEQGHATESVGDAGHIHYRRTGDGISTPPR